VKEEKYLPLPCASISPLHRGEKGNRADLTVAVLTKRSAIPYSALLRRTTGKGREIDRASLSSLSVLSVLLHPHPLHRAAQRGKKSTRECPIPPAGGGEKKRPSPLYFLNFLRTSPLFTLHTDRHGRGERGEEKILVYTHFFFFKENLSFFS